MRLLLALLVLLNLAAYLMWGMPPLPGKASVPVPVIESREAPELQLLAELDGTANVPVEEAAQTRAADPKVAGKQTVESPRVRPPAICYTFGSLPDPLLAERVQVHLRTRGYTVTLRVEERRGDLAGYWVLLSPQVSMEAAQMRVDDLRERGIDSFVVTEGTMRNAVSLGYFPGRVTAEQLQRQINAFGYDAQLMLRYTQETIHWLDLDEAGSERFDDATWRTVSDAYPKLGRYVRDCG